MTSNRGKRKKKEKTKKEKIGPRVGGNKWAGGNEVSGVQSYMVCYIQVHPESHAANKTHLTCISQTEWLK
jgi:hypothetical protein